MVITDEATVKDYYTLRQQLDTHTKDMRDVMMHPSYCLQFLQAGRLVKVKFKEHDFGWGAVVAFTPRRAGKGEILAPQQTYIVDILLTVASDTRFMPQVSDGLPPGVRPPAPGDKGKVEVVPVVLDCIESIGHLRVFLPAELKTTEQRNTVRKALDEVKKRFQDGIATLDPIENMQIKDEAFKRLLRVSSWLSFALMLFTDVLRKSKYLNHVFSRILYIIPLGYPSCTINTLTRLRLVTRSRLSRKKLRVLCQSFNLMS